ncbi:hypothetical protein [uncultured Novosphingobium sp.]|uniref:hypothetical protein n=1 Tax=uncultured Novosphingobium sp. TaxID=292277 RepID=UPI00374A12DF
MLNWFRKSSDAAVDPRDARIKELEEDNRFLLDRAKTAEALLQTRNSQIAALEQINADQSAQNRKLFQRNMELATQLASFIARRKGAGGRFVSTKQKPQVLGTVVSA